MALTNNEMINTLTLTPNQQKVFDELKAAYHQCLKHGIGLIGLHGDQQALLEPCVAIEEDFNA